MTDEAARPRSALLPLDGRSRSRPDAAAARRVRDADARGSGRRRDQDRGSARRRSRMRHAAAAGERPQRLLRRCSTATSAASRSICDRRIGRRPRRARVAQRRRHRELSAVDRAPARRGCRPRCRAASAADLRVDHRLRPDRPVRRARRARHQLRGARRPAPSRRHRTLPRPLIGDIGARDADRVAHPRGALQRERTGDGSIVDVSIHEARAWMCLVAHCLPRDDRATLGERLLQRVRDGRRPSGSRWARSSRSSGPASASGSAGPI